MKKVFLIVSAVLLTFSMAMNAQEAQSPDAGANVETDAERVVRIQTVIESDQTRLVDLRKELKQREDQFEQIRGNMAEREAGLKALEAQLDDTTDPDQRAALQAQIDAAREKYELVKRQADLAFQAEKTVRSQVKTLETKIDIDQQALDVLLGTAPMPEPLVKVSAVPQPGVAAPVQKLPGMIPGVPGAQTSAAEPGAVEEILQETAEQIEARKQAEKSEFEAEKAEQAVLSFLERKAALQELIDLEKSLLETAELSKVNFDQAVRIRRKELADIIAVGAGKAEIETAQGKLATVEKTLRRFREEIDKREDTLEGFYLRMQALQEEQLAVTEEAESKHQEAAAALKESAWLESPLNPNNVVRWAIKRGPNILAVILVAGVLLLVIRLFMQRIARAIVGQGRRARRNAATRADTLALSFGSASTIIIAVISILLVFEAAGVDIATILGGAAILGVAVAFGAQNLMRDYFNGFIILIEDQYELNDLVTINKTTGRVERVSLRTTALRDLQGKLHFIPNGEIKSVSNRSYEWAQIVFDIRVSYKENVDRVMEEILSVARQVCAEPENRDAIIQEPEMLGVDQFAEFGVVIKCLLRTEPKDLFRIKREILRRIKNRFDELGIEIPVPSAAAISK
jgi:small-conductance mechanosensitive channel